MDKDSKTPSKMNKTESEEEENEFMPSTTDISLVSNSSAPKPNFTSDVLDEFEIFKDKENTKESSLNISEQLPTQTTTDKLHIEEQAQPKIHQVGTSLVFPATNPQTTKVELDNSTPPVKHVQESEATIKSVRFADDPVEPSRGLLQNKLKHAEDTILKLKIAERKIDKLKTRANTGKQIKIMDGLIKTVHEHIADPRAPKSSSTNAQDSVNSDRYLDSSAIDQRLHDLMVGEEILKSHRAIRDLSSSSSSESTIDDVLKSSEAFWRLHDEPKAPIQESVEDVLEFLESTAVHYEDESKEVTKELTLSSLTSQGYQVANNLIYDESNPVRQRKTTHKLLQKEIDSCFTQIRQSVSTTIEIIANLSSNLRQPETSASPLQTLTASKKELSPIDGRETSPDLRSRNAFGHAGSRLYPKRPVEGVNAKLPK